MGLGSGAASAAIVRSRPHCEMGCGASAPTTAMDRLDRYTKMVVNGIVDELRTSEPILDSDLEQPILEGKVPVNRILVGTLAFDTPKCDPSCGDEDSLKLKVVAKALLFECIFPVDDIPIDFTDEEVVEALRLTQLDKLLPPPRLPEITDYQSDEALTWLAFNSVGCHRLEAITDLKSPAAAWRIDCNSLAKLEVRTGFERYGGCAWFAEDTTPLSITTPDGTAVRPTDGPKWELAKFSFRVSLLVMTTLVDHLAETHFGVASMMLLAAIESLQCGHRLRRALHPFLMRTALINTEAGRILLPDNSLFEHMTAFAYPEVQTILEANYKQGDQWRALPATVAAKNLNSLIDAGNLPYYEDGLELFWVFRSYFASVLAGNKGEGSSGESQGEGSTSAAQDDQLEEFWKALQAHTESEHLAAAYSLDALLDALAQFAFTVTAHHELVGSIADHLRDPTRGGSRIRPGSVRCDAQGFMLGAALMAFTSLPCPMLLSPFKMFWINAEETARWQHLQNGLQAVSEGVDNRNKVRKWRFMACNPRILECAVSL